MLLGMAARVAAQTPAPIPANVEARLSDWLSLAEPFGITGAVAILRDTTVTLIRGVGPLGPEGGRIGPDTPFLLASLSKQFTAAAILRSASKGHLSLTDSIGKFFPDAPSPQRGITVQQLLTHTSGMVYLERGMFDPAPDRAAMLREMIAEPLQFQPGARWSYSNPGYAVLGGILEKAEGGPFETAMTREIFAPAGMKATTFQGRPASGAPHGYQLGADQGPMSEMPGADHAMGNGSIVSTVRDLARWEVALRTNRVLDPHWTTELFTPRVAAAGGAQYAYGWNVLPTPRGTTLIFHAGDLGAFNSEFRRYVDDKFTLIWVSNARLATGGTREVVTRVVANLLNGAPVVDPPGVLPTDPAGARKVAGRYLLTGGDTLVVAFEQGALSIGATGAEGVAALAGGVSDTSAVPVAEAFAALDRGNDSLFRARLHPSLGAADAIDGTRRFLHSLADTLGASLRFDPIGAIAGTPGKGSAWIRISGPRGSLVAGFGLAAGGRIIAFADPSEVAAETPLKQSASKRNEFVAFDPATMRMTRVVFDGERMSVAVDGKESGDGRKVR